MANFITPPNDPVAYGLVEQYTGVRGNRTGAPTYVFCLRERTVYDLPPRLDLVNHSPDGFNWGYPGSGPAQLALAILADFTQDTDLALREYQKFKWAVIARLKGDAFTLSRTDISSWLESQSRATPQL